MPEKLSSRVFRDLSLLLKKQLFLFVCCTFTAGHAIAQQWTIIGNESQIASATSAYTSIAVVGNIPYVAFTESGVAKVKKKDLSTGNWEQVGADIASNATYTRIYRDTNNKLYVTYVDAAAGNKLAVVSLNASLQLWEPLLTANPYVSTGSVTNAVSQFSSTPRSSLAFDSNNVPYITFSDERSSTGNPYVVRFISGAWEILGGAPITSTIAVANNIAIDNTNVPYVVFVEQSTLTSTTGPLRVYRFDPTANSWENITPASPVTGGSSTTGNITSIRHTSIAMDNGFNPVVSYFNTSNNNKTTVIRYNRSTGSWSYTGAISGRDAPNNVLTRDSEGNVYSAFIDCMASGCASPTARVFKLAAGETSFTELKSSGVTSGIEVSVSNLNLAIGDDVSSLYIVYTKSNSSAVTTPVSQVFVPSAQFPVLTTNPVTDIASTSITAGGNITSDAGSAITERGIVYALHGNPTFTDNKVADATTPGTGSFNINVTGLLPGLQYYLRAYATNASGTSYGNIVRFVTAVNSDLVVSTPKQVEYLTRGVVAVRSTATSVYIGWRLLGTDPSNVAFNVYRDGVKINADPITNSTNFTHNTDTDGTYSVKAIISGTEGQGSVPVSIWATNQLSIPLQIPPGGTTPDGSGYTYSANDCSVGDVDGDGEYEIFIKWDPSNAHDNSQAGYTGNVYIDCYKINGTRLWRIDLGRNIRAGAHYTQFMVYDLDGDGKAEMACKTADATVDGTGVVIGNASADYRNSNGYILSGPEFLTVFNGQTGGAMATTDYLPARGSVSSWGDDYGNRVDRFIAAVAYLDGARPSLVMGRGYYTRLVRVAWDWRDGQLTHRWTFDSNNPGYGNYAGQGNHQMSIGDMDGDGKDEVLNGSSAIDDDGTGLWSSEKGHGDALHLGDIDPDRPGQEAWICLESPGSYTPYGLRLYDAKNGQTIWGVTSDGDIGRAMAGDVDPSKKGYEVWGATGGLYDNKGNLINNNKPSSNTGIWWDGDLGRELLDGTVLDKWNPATNSMSRVFTVYDAAPISSNNDTKKNIGLVADLFGDWREEMIYRRADNTALVIFTTKTPTDYRIPTLMHDPQYRVGIAWQNSGYNQPAYPSFYLGNDMAAPPMPNIVVKDPASYPTITGITRQTPAKQRTNANSVSFRLSFSESVSGVDVTDFALTATGTASGNITAVSNSSGQTFDVTVDNITGDGTLRVDVNNSNTSIVDAFGDALQTGFISGEHYIIDNTLPTLTTVTISTNNSNQNFAKEGDVVTLSFTASENIQTPVVTIAGQTRPSTLSSGSYISTYTLTGSDSEGNVEFTIAFTDEADNAANATATTNGSTVTYDRTAPSITAPANINTTTGSGVCEAVIADLGTPSTNDNYTVASVSNNHTGAFNKGTTIVIWTATDAAGNKTTANQNVSISDIELPVITTPSPGFLCNDGDQYTIPSATASDNCSVASVVYVVSGATERNGTGLNASGLFNPGESTIIWTITDGNGNQATGSTTVTVNSILSANVPDVNGVIEDNTIYKNYGPQSLTLTAVPDGGVGPYSFEWSTEETGASIDVNGAGTYTVTVFDNKGCKAVASKTIDFIDVTCGAVDENVSICHGGVTLCISPAEVESHLAHGDVIGKCLTTATGVEVMSSDIITAHPNPTSGELRVDFMTKRNLPGDIQIIDFNGRVVARRTLTPTGSRQSLVFNLIEMSDGLYLVRATTGNQTLTTKVVLQK